MCPGFVSLVWTRVVPLVIISSNATRFEDRRRGIFSVAFSSLVSTWCLVQNRAPCWTQKVMSKSNDGFKVAPFLESKQAGNLTTYLLWTGCYGEGASCSRHHPFVAQHLFLLVSTCSCAWGPPLTSKTKGHGSCQVVLSLSGLWRPLLRAPFRPRGGNDTQLV